MKSKQELRRLKLDDYQHLKEIQKRQFAIKKLLIMNNELEHDNAI